MVRFNIVNSGIYYADFGDFTDSFNVISNKVNVPFEAIKAVGFNTEEPAFREFIQLEKGIDETKMDKFIENIGKHRYIADVDILKCIMTAQKIKLDALCASENEIIENYNVFFDMQEMSGVKLYNLIDLFDSYCDIPYIDIYITICLEDIDFALVDREELLMLTFCDAERIEFTEYSVPENTEVDVDFEDDDISMEELMAEIDREFEKLGLDTTEPENQVKQESIMDSLYNVQMYLNKVLSIINKMEDIELDRGLQELEISCKK